MIEPTATLRTPERGFLHKRIGKFAGGLVRSGLGVISQFGPPGVRQAAQLARSFTPGGSRNLRFLQARAAQISRGNQASRFLTTGSPLEIVAKARSFGNTFTPGGNGNGDEVIFVSEGEQCPKGMHANKSSYFLKTGEFVPEMSRCVKNRRRNNDNGRAAMRAARRLLGRKRSQDTIDKALRAFAPRGRRRSAQAQPSRSQTIVTS